MFEKFEFSNRQINQYYQAALKDLAIAEQSGVPEIIFKFCYDSLLKLSIAVCAKNNLRIKSRQGHHIVLIKELARLLSDDNIEVIGDSMRTKRNLDLYGGGILITQKETAEYLNWLKILQKRVKEYLK